MRLALTLILTALFFVGCGAQDKAPATPETPAEGSNAHEGHDHAKATENVEAVVDEAQVNAEDAAEAVKDQAAVTEAAVAEVVKEVTEVVADVAAAADVEAMLAAAQKHLNAGKLDDLTAALGQLGEMELTADQKTLLQQLIDGAKKLGAAALANQLTGGQTGAAPAAPDAEAVKDSAKKAAAGALNGLLGGGNKE
jgi:hypothetical protein